MKITIIIGLPGSGKTTFIKNNKEAFKNAVICDDYHKSSCGHSHQFQDSLYYSDLIKALKNNKDIVLSDIAWCKKERKEDVEKNINTIINQMGTRAEIEFIYFENNPTACKQNILCRNRVDRIEKELEFVDTVSLEYYIPNNSKIIPITTTNFI